MEWYVYSVFGVAHVRHGDEGEAWRPPRDPHVRDLPVLFEDILDLVGLAGPIVDVADIDPCGPHLPSRGVSVKRSEPGELNVRLCSDLRHTPVTNNCWAAKCELRGGRNEALNGCACLGFFIYVCSLVPFS